MQLITETPTPHAAHVACWYCEDAHWIIDPSKVIGDKDRLMPCPACKWVDTHRMRILSQANDWTEAMARQTFERYDRSAPEVEDGYAAAHGFADAVILAWGKRRNVSAVNMPHDAPWAVTLYGPFGTGKTHLAAAIANAAVVPTLYCNAQNLWAYLGCIPNPDPAESYEGRIMAVMQVPLLLLDEIGGSISESGGAGAGVSEAAWGKRHRIMEFRYSRRMPTVLLDQRHPRFWGDPAVASRVTEDGNETIPHGQDDYRAKLQRTSNELSQLTMSHE